VEDKTRVGACIDTCHAFAAGYDLRTQESCKQVFDGFDKVIGMKYLKGMHLNESKAEFKSRKDRHEVIEKARTKNGSRGKIGLECFKFIVNDERFAKVPLILETEEPFDKQINFLRSLITKKEPVTTNQ